MSQAFPMPVPFCRFSPLLRVPPPYRTAQRSPCRTHWYNLWVGQSWALRHAQDLVLSELEELDVLFFFRTLGVGTPSPIQVVGLTNASSRRRVGRDVFRNVFFRVMHIQGAWEQSPLQGVLL